MRQSLNVRFLSAQAAAEGAVECCWCGGASAECFVQTAPVPTRSAGAAGMQETGQRNEAVATPAPT